MHKLNEKGFIHALLFLLLLAGLGVGVYLVQTKTGLFSKAAPIIPDKPETSFRLAVDKAVPKNIPLGSKFRVDIWTRSDIDPANTFVAKLKFNPDELQVVEVSDGNQSFVNQWIEKTFDNTAGKVSIVGGVNPPGLLTSSQGSGNVKGVSSDSCQVSGITCGTTTATSVTINNISLVDNGWGADGWAVFQGNARRIYTNTNSTNSYTLNNLTPATAYDIKVGCYKETGRPVPSTTGFSDTITCITQSPASPPPTGISAPISTVPPFKPTLMPPRLMASIIFEAKKAGNTTIHFADTSQILRSVDGLNIISAKKDLAVRIAPAAVSAPIPVPTSVPKAVLSFDPSTSNLNRGCNFSVNVNVDTGGAKTDGTDAILLYDPSRLTANSITSGKIYADYPADEIDQNAGKITISGLSSVSTPFTGKGTLATVNFSVKDSAPLETTKIHFDFDPSNKNKSTDSNVVERETVVDALDSVINGSYTVGTGSCSSEAPSTGTQSRRSGDVNNNGKIDLVDMSRLLAQFGKSGQSEADLNGDGVVNTVDILQLRNILIQNGTLSGR